jgi:SAM-dependent methyltransferase
VTAPPRYDSFADWYDANIGAFAEAAGHELLDLLGAAPWDRNVRLVLRGEGGAFRLTHRRSRSDRATLGTVRYDSERIAAFFDEYGEREWARFEDGRNSPISLAVHAHYLRRFVGARDRVLDAGAGPGRFTVELARLGATVTVADISPRQLELNRRTLIAAGLEDHIAGRVQADILDLGTFDDDAFDATVCYGGPLSYVLDRADGALGELLRVTRAGGPPVAQRQVAGRCHRRRPHRSHR